MGRKRNRETGTKGSVPVCPGGHALERRTADGDYECDACGIDLSAGLCYFGCGPCDYSVCGGCYVKMATTGLEDDQDGAAPAAANNGSDRIDPDVAELCDHYDIEDRVMLKLNEAMSKRQATFEGDIGKLWDELKTARSPAGLLMSKIRQMEEGTFIGRVEPPKELKRLIEKYRLDEDARTKLADFLSKRPSTAKEDFAEIERRLESSGRPSATVMTMIVKLQRGERLPDSVLPNHRDQDVDLFKRRSSRADGDRDRERPRSRSRGRR
mmetsp:Transcript_41637/g.130019  ORF Transcript_41637/g.130019 Transcript_41637/m.130019 type:complete len:268 (-) Transcript_41637:157-960(-)